MPRKGLSQEEEQLLVDLYIRTQKTADELPYTVM